MPAMDCLFIACVLLFMWLDRDEIMLRSDFLRILMNKTVLKRSDENIWQKFARNSGKFWTNFVKI